ncbi:hypothetical protein OU415_02330 [Saccharopolyspora sp. WRP15-2]|uniref:Uncharacterized protein n=1 Tax=Saccharopolyspora oryzae TaxID=2997343 RepID=A0ABT4URB5_9PSEU|nr:hypothetical protein [Saccharopolyspora oryzae]MDA3624254.1 hypothetical protein [Saccharopolyspora oryzae]
MADPLDVLTLAEAKQALNISESVTKHDAELPSYITAVSQRLDLYIGPVVQRTVTNEVHDGGRPSVFLDLFPVVSVTQVIEYSDTTSTVLTAESNAVKPDEAYLLERYDVIPSLWSGRLLRRRAGRRARFESGQANVAVSYVAGRCASTAEVPERYKLAAKFMLENFWRSQLDATGGVNEFDMPQANFPRWGIPMAARQLVSGEIQEPRQVVL